MQKALGLIETIGLVPAIEAADAAVKAANVVLLGYENTKGGGKITIKLVGDVGAVKAAVSAGVAAASRIGRVYGCHVIPRPNEEISALIRQVDRGQVKTAPAASPLAAPPAPVPPAVQTPEPPQTPPIKPLDELPAAMLPEAPAAETAAAPSAAPEIPAPESAAPEASAAAPAPRCAAITKSGERCSLPARAGSLYCNVHRKLDQTPG